MANLIADCLPILPMPRPAKRELLWTATLDVSAAQTLRRFLGKLGAPQV
ncbi:MAG: hypothetical protein LBH31_05235 [Burkholderiaceae bacterium]|nr:hypothetical protein [Burkholderiaceae bacterium]